MIRSGVGFALPLRPQSSGQYSTDGPMSLPIAPIRSRVAPVCDLALAFSPFPLEACASGPLQECCLTAGILKETAKPRVADGAAACPDIASIVFKDSARSGGVCRGQSILGGVIETRG